MATRHPPEIAAETGVHARLRQHGFWMRNTVLAPLEPREKHVVFQRNMRCEILKEPIQTGIERPPRPASVVRGCQVAGHFADPLDRFGVVVMLGAHHSNRRPDACPPARPHRRKEDHLFLRHMALQLATKSGQGLRQIFRGLLIRRMDPADFFGEVQQTGQFGAVTLVIARQDVIDQGACLGGGFGGRGGHGRAFGIEGCPMQLAFDMLIIAPKYAL